MLRLLPKSWLAKEDKANAAMALWALARAESCADAYAAHSTPKPLATAVITEPKSHIEAMHAPDAAEWQVAFDKNAGHAAVTAAMYSGPEDVESTSTILSGLV